jgi:hypothetical protein
MIVENKLTPLTRDEAARALSAAYQRLTGSLPRPGVLALLLAQSALETGNWQKIHNFNFGNAKAALNYPLIVQFRCSELDAQGVELFFDPPDPHCNFRAYNDAASGALDYLKVLHSRPTWWQGLHTENPSSFVDALATPPKYFTANPDRYKRTVTALFESFRPLAVAVLAHPAAPSPPIALPGPVAEPPSSLPSPPLGSSGADSAAENTANAPPTAPRQLPSLEEGLGWLRTIIVFIRWLVALLRGGKGP